MKKIRVFEAFSGIGAQAMACKRLQKMFPDKVEFEFIGTSEIEPAAIKAYKAIHGDTHCYGDICKIDWSQVPNFDLFTWSFPCQDISNAGKQGGLSKESGTRSSLAWEAIRAIGEKRPKYALMENVAALCQKKFSADFAQLRKELEVLGYANFHQLINSKDMGIPQNRLRVFMVSILRTEDDQSPTYNFPTPFPLTKCVEDYMEPAEDIGEEYFISQDRVTNKVLSDILDQPNVRAEMEKLYHEEWGKIRPKTKPTYHFVSLEWLIREDCRENLGDHFQVYKAIFSTADGLREEEIKVSIWYHTPDMYRNDIRKAIEHLTYVGVDNLKELEDAIYQDLVTNSR